MSSIAQTLMNRSHLIEGTVVVEKCCVDYDQPLPAQRFAVNLEGATVLRVVDSALIGSECTSKQRMSAKNQHGVIIEPTAHVWGVTVR